MTTISDILQSYFPANYSGVLVEVGAAHPLHISVSFPFRPLGVQERIWHSYFEHNVPLKAPNGTWEIISIEPNPDFCNEFRKNNLSVLQYACTNKDIGLTTFKIAPDPMSYSALKIRISGEPEENFKTIPAEAYTLNTILQKRSPLISKVGINKVDILVIDAEGWGMEVLEGFDLDKYQPLLVLVEIIGSPQSPDYYADYMAKRGYVYGRDMSPNMLFVKQSNETGNTGTLQKEKLHGLQPCEVDK